MYITTEKTMFGNNSFLQRFQGDTRFIIHVVYAHMWVHKLIHELTPEIITVIIKRKQFLIRIVKADFM